MLDLTNRTIQTDPANTQSASGLEPPSLKPVFQSLANQFAQVRAHSIALAVPLSAEDMCIQSMPDASPTKWHLAHTTWFFETLVLQAWLPDYQIFDPHFHYLFNSYYEALGPRHPRMQRGLLTRPSVSQVMAYRTHVDAAMMRLLLLCEQDQITLTDAHATPSIQDVLRLGLHHEQQHQELLLTDILHAFSCNPVLPAYTTASATAPALTEPVQWLRHAGGMAEIGCSVTATDDFAFDNETPRHQVWLQPFEIASQLVSCGEYAKFIADGGYQRAEFWLSEGWAMRNAQDWQAPAYWLAADDPRVRMQPPSVLPDSRWYVFGLNGVQPMQPDQPVAQLSFFEAAAYAQWAGARLPTEFEWEAAFSLPSIRQMQGAVWQWTRSSYDPYPGFKPLSGVASEYNGKFMVSQLVLRGASCATPAGHARPSYRNFFPPSARWQFSGIRLARDAQG